MSELFSYSKLDTFAQCKFKYYLKYTLDNYVYSDSIATKIGTLVHETEESIANSIIAGETIDYVKLKNNFIIKLYELKHRFPKDYVELDKSNRTYDEKTYAYLETGIYALEKYMQEHPTYKIVGVEKEFNIAFAEGKNLRGFIDRVFYDTAADHYIIQDIKTYAIPVEKDKLTTPLQFVVYTLAAQELFNCDSKQISCQYYLPFCALTQDAGTLGYMSRGITKLNKLFDGIDNKEAEPNPTPLCHWCEFCNSNDNAPQEGRFLCPYYCHWTRENKTFAKENEWQGLDKHEIILEQYKKKNNIV